VGMFLLGLIQLTMSGKGMNPGLQKRVDAMGIWGSLLLGVVFALTFCPTSAALFFGSLVPLSLKMNSSVALPAIYGVGTALPVIVFAVLLATSAQSVGKAYNVLAKIEWWARMLTGWIFILVGIYFALAYVFQVI
jgi:cytochrome c-type biogenesis protein